MNHMTTLGQVSEKIDAMSQNCHDGSVDIRDLEFDSLSSVKISGEKHTLLPLAEKAICYRLGIPHQYLKKCPADIQALNLRHWKNNAKTEELFVRFNGNLIRGFLSSRYVPLDNSTVLGQLLSFGYKPETEVQCHLDDEFMLLNIPDPEQEYSIKAKDRIQSGISLRNSELGLSSLSIAGFVLRLVCTNGMVTRVKTAGSSYRHVSAKVIEQLPIVLAECIAQQDSQADKFKLAIQVKVDDPLATLESLNRQYMLSTSEKTAVIEWAWPQEEGDSYFHIVNAYTRAAQADALSAESSYRLQRAGGEILAMVN